MDNVTKPPMKPTRRLRSHRARSSAAVTTLCTVCVLASAWMASMAHAGPNTAEARKLFAAGQYAPAERLLLSEVERDGQNGEALIALADVYERTGRYEELVETLESAAKVDAVEADANVRLAEHAARIGNPKSARKQLEKLLEGHPDHMRAMLALGNTLNMLGRKNDAARVLNQFASVYNAGKADTAESLTYVGIAMFRTESYQDANQALAEAIEADSRYVNAYVEAGFLYLEKYNQRDADEMFRNALELDPNHPLAHVGAARVYLDSSSDFESASREIDTALAVHPKLVEALAVRAEIYLSDENTKSALEVLEEALAINPHHLHVLALKASAYYLDDDTKSQRKVEKAVLALNPRYADLYVTMAHYGEIAHRYQEGITLYEKALDIDKHFWRAFVGLGIAYTRIGDDTKGFEYLEKAFEADPYNVRAYNMVELYDRTLKHYDFLEGEYFKFRLHRDEKDLLSLYVGPLMEGAYSIYVRKYDFTPSKPVSVEIFPDMTSFSVRSVGLPAISPQGICFGKVITARSPADGNFNWAQVLWHELAHVFHIQLSDSRVPRWFTEGLAELETVVARREWRRERDIELHLALRDSKILGVERLNQGFTHAKSIEQVLLAYYQSSLVVEFIEARWTFDKIVEMLKAWADRKKTPEVLASVLGVTVKEFDAAFLEWLTKRLAYLDASYELDLDAFVVDYEAFMGAAAANPGDAEAQANAGLAELFQLRIDPARERLNTALGIDKDSVRANYLGGIIALREGAYEKALEYYARLNELGIDGYTIQSEIAFSHLKIGNTDDAITHYDAAKKFFPQGEEPYRELAKLYLERKEPAKARRELEQVVTINQNDFESASKLFTLALDAGEINDARRFGELALDINPFQAELHASMARIGVKQQDWLLAEREFKAYLVLAPGQPFEGYLGLAEVYVELGQKGLARDYIERAKATRPDDPAISRVENRLR